MSIYDWDKILSNSSDVELKRIYRQQDREPKDKVDAAIRHLMQRGLIDENEQAILKKQEATVDNIIDYTTITSTSNINVYAKAAMILVAFVMLMDLVSFYSFNMQANLLEMLTENIDSVSYEELDANDSRVQTIAIIHSIIFAISGIVFILWFNKAYTNLKYRVSRLQYDLHWTVSGWLIPIISLFRPVQIMEEMNTKTNQILKARGVDEHRYKKNGIIFGWWIYFILNYFASSSLGKIFNYTDSIEDLLLSTNLDMILNLIGIPLAIITIIMVKNYNDKETILFELEQENKTNSTREGHQW